jgi:hypothetical protein
MTASGSKTDCRVCHAVLEKRPQFVFAVVSRLPLRSQEGRKVSGPANEDFEAKFS